MEEIKELNTIEQIKAYSDPLRIKIINEFYNMRRPATVKQIADSMKLVPANIHYHVKKLEKVGILILDHTEIINGIVAKYYEPAAKSFSISDRSVDDSVSKIMKSELAKTVHNIYSLSEEILLNEINKTDDSGRNDQLSDRTSDMWILGKENLYALPEEIEGLRKYLNDFIESHCKLKEDPNIREFHIFASAVDIGDGKTDKS